MNTKKILFTTTAIIIAVVSGVAYYEYNKPVQDVAELTAQAVSAVGLFKEFKVNEPQANKSYLNKALQVSGKVMEVKQKQNAPSQIILDAGDPLFGIACTMDQSQKNVKPGDMVTIKGICTGYLNDVIIIKSFLLN